MIGPSRGFWGRVSGILDSIVCITSSTFLSGVSMPSCCFGISCCFVTSSDLIIIRVWGIACVSSIVTLASGVFGGVSCVSLISCASSGLSMLSS